MGTEITCVNAPRDVDLVDLVTLGEPIVCLDTRGGRLADASLLHVSLGGAECNVAIGLARLGHDCVVIGRVGDDPFGQAARRRLLAEGVDVTQLTADPAAPTALLFKEQTYRGAEVHYRRAGCAGSRVAVDDIDVDVVAAARAVHVTGVTAALGTGPRAAVVHLMATARQAGARVSFDANLRRKLASPADLVDMFHALCHHADDVFMGWSEAELVAGDASEDAIRAAMVAIDRPCVVVKRPAGGAICLEGGRWRSHDAPSATVVDPIGAGDAFAVGFLHGRLGGASTAEALALGADIAARVIAVHGDNAALPYAVELGAARVGVHR
jgi:2-dehydro-3-deoxygluconokinase